MVIISPSIISSNLTQLGEQVKLSEAAHVDMFHLDVMDGHFVPNLTMGPDVVKAIRSVATVPLEVHLMV